MEVENQVVPDMTTALKFFEAEEDGPFIMVNLLKFKDIAEYEDESEPKITGREAYAKYGAVASESIQKVGGRMIVSGQVTGVLLGEIEENWDMIALVEYPSLAAFRNMTTLPEFTAASRHRTAGLKGQLNIKMKAMTI